MLTCPCGLLLASPLSELFQSGRLWRQPPSISAQFVSTDILPSDLPVKRPFTMACPLISRMECWKSMRRGWNTDHRMRMPEPLFLFLDYSSEFEAELARFNCRTLERGRLRPFKKHQDLMPHQVYFLTSLSAASLHRLPVRACANTRCHLIISQT